MSFKTHQGSRKLFNRVGNKKSIKMKKNIKSCLFVLLVSITILSSSCATILGGKVSDYQRTKPTAGQPGRKLRVVAFVGDVCFGLVPVIVDFATGAIYRPENK